MNQVFEDIANVAVSLVKDNMIVGLGSGSTAEVFIRSLAEKYRKDKLNITCMASSCASESLAKSLKLKVIPLKGLVDITFDGTDQIDNVGNLIKGRGGALFREKILAYNSKQLIILAHVKKEVKQLGCCLVPIEVAPFGCENTKHNLKNIGYDANWRKKESDKLFITDNGNYILDVVYNDVIKDPHEEEKKIKSVVGVIETGFFFRLAKGKIIGRENHKAKIEFF
jgi:ribose 5-phosphate isomerase A